MRCEQLLKAIHCTAEPWGCLQVQTAAACPGSHSPGARPAAHRDPLSPPRFTLSSQHSSAAMEGALGFLSSLPRLQLPPSNPTLPSSAAAPSELSPCSSPGSELPSRAPGWAPSARHPLELELGKGLRRNTKPHVRNSASAQLGKQSF